MTGELDGNKMRARLTDLHTGEEQLRSEAVALVVEDASLRLHLSVVEEAMDLADWLRKFETEDEDFKVVQVLGMLLFNAFGASVKLALAGYHQNSALIMRGILETIFLIDLFEGDRGEITSWRLADEKKRRREYKPYDVRRALNKRDGFVKDKRGEVYELFSEFAGHPTMKSAFMMRPEKDGDAFIGPFIEKTSLDAVLSEMGKLAVQAGELLNSFFPKDWTPPVEARLAFNETKQRWLKTFYPSGTRESQEQQ